LLCAAIVAKQTITIPLPDGRQLKMDRPKGEVRVQIVADAKMQSEVARARFRHPYEE
jgi:hypothetical protein